MLVQIITNSQGSSVGVAPGENYPALAGTYLGPQYDVRPLVVSGWTLADIVNNLDDNVVFLKPDLVVFQIGIVEAAQRILSNREKNLLALLPFGRHITAAMHRHRASVLGWRKRLGIGTRVVEPKEFERLLDGLAAKLRSNGIRFVFVPVPLFPDEGRSLSHPLINEDVSLYNGMLARFECLAIGADVHDRYFQSGTVHLSVEGHNWVARSLADELRRIGPLAA
jgi:lysophospholipase L1-like esterase